MPSRKPSARRFVVRGLPEAELRKRLGDGFRVKMIDGKDDAAIVEPVTRFDDAKEANATVRSRVGAGVFVSPVLEDDAGGLSLPTGKIQVRFTKPPSDEEGEAFARENGLRVVQRNAYQAAQVVFEPIDAETYLPEVVSKAEEKKEVRRAWEVTEGQYLREK